MNLKIFTKNIEEKAAEQISRLVAQPAFSDCKIRIMPDVHAGAGCVIGFTANLGDKVIPNVVGVDIGCGMITCELGKVDIDFDKLDSVIRENIPSGLNVHENAPERFTLFMELNCYPHLKNMSWLENSMRTLGGGNHFIEIDKDNEDNKYLIVHTGSRNLGKQVADYYQSLAIDRINGTKAELEQKVKELIADLKEQHRETEISSAIKNLRDNFYRPEKDAKRTLLFNW